MKLSNIKSFFISLIKMICGVFFGLLLLILFLKLLFSPVIQIDDSGVNILNGLILVKSSDRTVATYHNSNTIESVNIKSVASTEDKEDEVKVADNLDVVAEDKSKIAKDNFNDAEKVVAIKKPLKKDEAKMLAKKEKFSSNKEEKKLAIEKYKQKKDVKKSIIENTKQANIKNAKKNSKKDLNDVQKKTAEPKKVKKFRSHELNTSKKNYN